MRKSMETDSVPQMLHLGICRVNSRATTWLGRCQMHESSEQVPKLRAYLADPQ